MEKTYSKEQFQALVTELESELSTMLKSAQAESAQPLVKSEEAPKEENKEEEKKEEAKEEPQESKAEESSSDEKKDEAPKAEENKEESDDESHGYDNEDMEEMSKMYTSMSKGELKAHKESIEKCWMGKCGETTQMVKSEETTKIEPTTVVVEESTLLKSELDTIKKENQDLKKNIDGLVSAINSYVTKKAPARKAITDIEFVKKSEEANEVKPLTKSEIKEILAKKAQDPSLPSKDREAINQFYLTNASVEKISHLLKQ